MSNQIQIVNFHDQSLITLQKDNVAYVAMKSVCENIGLDWEAQRQRISRDEVLNSVACMIKATASDRKTYQMLCLPIHYLNGWLFGVDVNRVKENNREKLITYKKECYQALHDYWHKGVAVNERAMTAPACITPQTLTELAPITPFKSHMSAADSQEVIKEMRQVYDALVPLIRQVADCYYDKQMAFSQIEATIEHYCGVKNSHWITLERLPTALTVLSIMKNEATAHKKMMHRLDDNARLALSYKTVNAIGYTGETFDGVEV